MYMSAKVQCGSTGSALSLQLMSILQATCSLLRYVKTGYTISGIRNFGKFKHYNMPLFCLGASRSYSLYTKSLFNDPQIYSIDSCHSNLSRLLPRALNYGGVSLRFRKTQMIKYRCLWTKTVIYCLFHTGLTTMQRNVTSFA